LLNHDGFAENKNAAVVVASREVASREVATKVHELRSVRHLAKAAAARRFSCTFQGRKQSARRAHHLRGAVSAWPKRCRLQDVVTSGVLLQECVTSLFRSWVVLTKFVHVHGSLMNVF
jgi:hypothetical protein